MKKKFLSFIMALFIMIPCMMVFSACTPNEEPPLTNAELSVIYKEIAVGAWEKIGVDDPTQTAQLMTAIPDFKSETTVAGQIQNIKVNANSTAGMLYMLSLLYGNENFITTNNIAVFDAHTTIMNEEVDQNYVLRSSINKLTNKVYLEAVITTKGTKQYSNFEADYNFETKELIAFRFCSSIGEFGFVDMALTEDNKYLWYEPQSASDQYAVALLAKRDALEESASGIEKLNSSFDAEIQAYMTVLEKAINDLNQNS